MSLLYNDKRINKSHACAYTSKLLMQAETNIVENMPHQQRREMRKMMIACFLGTDMSRHFDVLTKFKLRVETEEFSMDTPADRALLMTVLVHCADISYCCRPPPVAAKWAELKLDEMWRQGDTEKTFEIPVSNERVEGAEQKVAAIAAMQADFCDYVVGPVFGEQALKRSLH